MIKVNKIAVPVDFLGNTEKLLDYVKYMAKSHSAELHLIHIIPVAYGEGLWSVPHSQEATSAVKKQINARMEEFVEQFRQEGFACNGTVVVGDPVEEIVNVAKKVDADMMIICSHGAKGLEKVLLGSVTQRVIKRVHCPILVMNPYRNKLQASD